MISLGTLKKEVGNSNKRKFPLRFYLNLGLFTEFLLLSANNLNFSGSYLFTKECLRLNLASKACLNALVFVVPFDESIVSTNSF